MERLIYIGYGHPISHPIKEPKKDTEVVVRFHREEFGAKYYLVDGYELGQDGIPQCFREDGFTDPLELQKELAYKAKYESDKKEIDVPERVFSTKENFNQ